MPRHSSSTNGYSWFCPALVLGLGPMPPVACAPDHDTWISCSDRSPVVWLTVIEILRGPSTTVCTPLSRYVRSAVVDTVTGPPAGLAPADCGTDATKAVDIATSRPTSPIRTSRRLTEYPVDVG